MNLLSKVRNFIKYKPIMILLLVLCIFGIFRAIAEGIKNNNNQKMNISYIGQLIKNVPKNEKYIGYINLHKNKIDEVYYLAQLASVPYILVPVKTGDFKESHFYIIDSDSKSKALKFVSNNNFKINKMLNSTILATLDY